MKNKKLLFSIAMLLILSLFLAACGNTENTPNNSGEDTPANTNTDTNADDAANANGDSDADVPEFISLLTGGTSGTYYPLGGAMAKIISDETGMQADALSSNASADNVIALKDGEAELAMVQTDVVADAIQGINAFDGEPVDNVLALGSLYPETVQIVTADSEISAVTDLKGKTVSVGAPGSGTYINAEQIMEIHGMTMDDIDASHLDFSESTGGIQDGNIDAAFITAGTPTGAVEGLSATTDVFIVPIDQDKVDELITKYPYYASDVIPAGTYGLEGEIQTVAVLAMIAVTDSLSEDVVYNITKAIYENTDQIAHAKGELITLESALDGIGIDLHPGAEKYFTEQGITSE